MEIRAEIEEALDARIRDAESRFGPFASTHEALGVASEEWDELRAAVHANALGATYRELLDLAAVLLRLAEECYAGMTTLPSAFRMRSGA